MIVIPSFRGLVARVFTEESGPESGSLYAWGFNGSGVSPSSGQLGILSILDRSSPVLINSSTGFSGSVSGWTKVSSGFEHTLGINSGKLYSWGSNYTGRLGLGLSPSNTVTRSSPVQVGIDSNWTAISAGRYHSLALKSDGNIWAWGSNGFGQLGIGNTDGKSSPVTTSGSSWSKISAGWNHSLAIKEDGSLWAWGYNFYGQLGDYSTSNRSNPVKIKDGTSWTMVSAGANHSLAIRLDGTLWAWGSNGNGRLGIGTAYENDPFTFAYLSPMQVGSDNDWYSVSAGGYHSLAIKNNNTLWSWGENSNGQLGKGDTTDRSAPSQITGSTWKMASAGIDHSGAINSYDKMFFWGRNNLGQIGDNSTTHRSSPVPIMSSSDWLYIASMKDNSSFAIKKP